MCIIVVPLNAAFGEANLQEDPLRMLEMATIRQNHPWLYYLHAAVVWLVCFTVHFFIDQALKKFLKFRMKWMEAVPIPQSTTVLVEAVPADWRSDGKLKMFFQKVWLKGLKGLVSDKCVLFWVLQKNIKRRGIMISIALNCILCFERSGSNLYQMIETLRCVDIC